MTTRLHGGILAAAFLSAILTCWGASPAFAYTAGSGASGSVTIPTYADVAAYLARSDTSEVGYVQIGSRVYPEWRIHGVDGLTDATLVATYADVAAWKADTNRGDKLFAVIGGNLYDVDHLQAFDDAGILSDSSLPSAEPQTPGALTTAVGDQAVAGGREATAVGESAAANGPGSTAIGRAARAEDRAVSVGSEALADGQGSVAIGDYTHAYGNEAVAVRGTVYGDGAVSLGAGAHAIGNNAVALGRDAVAAELNIGQSLNDVIPSGATELLRCVNGQHGDPVNANDFPGWLQWCDQYLTSSEKADSDLNANTAAGRTFRQEILTRLQGVLDGFQVSRATAIGAYARATGDYATAVGYDSEAAADRSTALGYYAGALATRTTALGRYARVYDERSTGVGSYAIVKGDRSTAVGANAAAHGSSATVMGYFAHAMGEEALAIGRGAQAAKTPADQYLYQVLPGGSGNQDPGWIAECAYDPWYANTPSGLKDDCDPFLTAAERNNANLDADSADGRTLRAAIRTRLAGLLDDLDVKQATAIGTWARAAEDYATATGNYAQAVGAASTAVGNAAVAGTWATASGQLAFATGRYSAAHGSGAQAHGENSIAIGGGSIAGGVSVGSDMVDRWVYVNVDGYLDNADRADDTNANVIIGGKIYSVAALENVHTTTMGGLTRDNLPAPLVGKSGAIAIGQESRAAETDSIALGRAATVSGANGIAFGRGAQATGANAIAIGAGVTAAANRVVIGSSGHSYVLPGLAASQTANAEVLTVDSDGALTADGGALHGRVGTLETALGAASDSADADGSVYARLASQGGRVGTLETALGAASDSADADGSVYARLASQGGRVGTLETALGAAGDAADAGGSVYARIKEVRETATAAESGLGEASDAASSTGSAYARIADLQEGLGTIAAGPDKDGNAYERIKALRDVVDTASADEFAAIGRANVLAQVDDATRALNDEEITEVVERVASQAPQTVKVRVGSGEERTVVKLTGASNEQIMALVALLTDNRLSTTPVVGEDGQPVGTTMTEFLALDAEKALAEAADQTLTPEQRAANAAAATERLAYLFQALYGVPYGQAGIADPATDSDNPHEGSIAGRLDNIDDFMPRSEDGTLEEAPVDAGGQVPAGVIRSVVVQDVYTENGRQRVVLRSLDLGRLAGVDRRVDALDQRVTGLAHGLADLDQRVDEAIAMTSALTALPNVVPGAKQFFLGAGTGFYRGEEAFSLGMAARLDADRKGRQQVYVNAGFASGYSGDGFTGRIGMGIAW